jgi:acetate kinase
MMRVLVVNAGSSSLKLRLLDHDDTVESTLDVDDWSGDVDTAEVTEFVDSRRDRIEAIGHRVVHGGPKFRGPVSIDKGTRDQIEALTDLAPLHQPRALAGIDAFARLLSDVPAVACFDTTFHATLPEAAATVALPAAIRQRWNLRRYGFHGLSHQYASHRAGELLGHPDRRRIVTCHLGSGASLAAVDDGRSVDTTMGFTPLDGLVMATRSGSLDPGMLLWLLDHEGLSPAEATDMLEHHSGLAGLSGDITDLRRIYARADDGDTDCELAILVYIHRLRAGIAAMAAAMNGLEAVVFTGGVGEHLARLRAETVAGLRFLGLGIDTDANTTVAEGDVSAATAGARTLVVAAREDLAIAAGTRAVLSG